MRERMWFQYNVGSQSNIAERKRMTMKNWLLDEAACELLRISVAALAVCWKWKPCWIKKRNDRK